MKRRALLASGVALACTARLPPAFSSPAPLKRVRPGETGWPGTADWNGLNQNLGGKLIAVHSPLAECVASPASSACADLFRNLRNPYFIGDSPALTQTLGWTDAWRTQPSAYAVAARSSAEVAAAVNFARTHRLRLVVKGGGHSYLGTSNAANSLLIWTRPLNSIDLHHAFVAQGCYGRIAAQPAVSLGAGVIWSNAYDAVTTKAGRYVQGGGCMTVGVAGLVQSGGFGSFSKGFGTAAAGLLEAEIVTADGAIRIANPATNPDLFWAIKGGGGGSFGVLTRVTLRTPALPQFFGAVVAKIEAKSDAAFRKLVEKIMIFYHDSLLNPHWGEQISFDGRTLSINMLFQDLTKAQAAEIWRPLLEWVRAAPADYSLNNPLIIAMPARHWWDWRVLKPLPGIVQSDSRSDAPACNIFWSGDAGQVGQFLHGYKSLWLPQDLLAPSRRHDLIDALVAAAAIWQVSLHFNKGLAGATPDIISAARDTATNPAMLDAFALAIIAGEEPPAYPGVAGHEPNLPAGRRAAHAIAASMAPLQSLVAAHASYVSESDFFDTEWSAAYWGVHYARLSAVKKHYDPDGLFIVHHGVGSEHWSADGFTRVA